MSNRNSFIESTKETDKRLEALKQLYPEIFSDGKINLDAFKDVTNTSDLPEGQDKTPGYYGLYWPGKRAAKQLARKEAAGTLEPVAGDGVNEDSTHNIYIEGDNLEVLRILKQSYKGRVKMIYIDPPYNTGNDFIYPDDFKMPVEEYLKLTGQVDESGKKLVSNSKDSGSYHTNWLNMMYPRLQLARELLTEDGVIFISIDDNEQSNLKTLCDDVFGEENFIANFVIKSNPRGSMSANEVADLHEYLILYTKGRDYANIIGHELTEDMTSEYKYKDELGEYRLLGLRMRGGFWRRTDRPNLYFPIYVNPKTGAVSLEKKEGFSEEALPVQPTTMEDGTWRWGKNKITEENNLLLGKQVKRGDELVWDIYQKDYLVRDTLRRTKAKSIWEENEINYQNGTTEIKNLFNKGGIFDYSKPVFLLEQAMRMIALNTNDLIMDFFSGSATTAQAVMQLNKEDNGNRKFIMVQLPQKCEETTEAAKAGYKNICEIGKERIRRAGAKILEEAKENKDMFSEDNPLDVGFKVYRMTTSNFKKYTPVSGQDKEAENSLFKELEGNLVPLVEGWKPENVLTEIILKQGFALDCKKEKLDSFKKNTVYKITDSQDAVCKKITLYVCLDTAIEKETIDTLKLNDDEKFICLDAAIDDSAYARLSDKGRIETI